MKTVIEMAREAGLVGGPVYARGLERFAELVRADEREKYKWDVHSCGPTCKRYACVAMREAVEAEREACAKVCDWYVDYSSNPMNFAENCAQEIRARGKKS
jgi:hypothetical protein